MVDSANDSMSSLQSALAAARQDAAKASARAQEASAMAARHESAGCTAPPALLTCIWPQGARQPCCVGISMLTAICIGVQAPLHIGCRKQVRSLEAAVQRLEDEAKAAGRRAAAAEEKAAGVAQAMQVLRQLALLLCENVFCCRTCWAASVHSPRGGEHRLHAIAQAM